MIVSVEVIAVFDRRCSKCGRTYRERVVVSDPCSSVDPVVMSGSARRALSGVVGKIGAMQTAAVCSTCMTWPHRIEGKR